MVLPGDRRRRRRIALHWPVCLYRQKAGESVESTTENLSSEGLYCITKQRFKPGERLRCEIVLPAEGLGYQESSIRLQCNITVKRVENLQVGFGLGCHIEDYALLTGSLPTDM